MTVEVSVEVTVEVTVHFERAFAIGEGGIFTHTPQQGAAGKVRARGWGGARLGGAGSEKSLFLHSRFGSMVKRMSLRAAASM